MKFLRQFSVLLLCALFCVAAVAAEQPAPVVPPPTQASPATVSVAAVLPTEFAGWQLKGAVARSDDPAVADAANAAVLKEYGFARLEKAAYTRDDGRNLAIRAAVFEDASGAYGASLITIRRRWGRKPLAGKRHF